MSESSGTDRLIPIWMWIVCWGMTVPILFTSDPPTYTRVPLVLLLGALTIGLFNRRQSD